MDELYVRVVPKNESLGAYLVNCMGYWGNNNKGRDGVFGSVNITMGVDEIGKQVWIISNQVIDTTNFEYLGDWINSYGADKLREFKQYPRIFTETDLVNIIIGK